MPNKYNNPISATGPARPGNQGAKPASGMKEKVGFPGAQLPGKSQPADRSAGVKRCKQYPDSKGL